MKPVEALTVSCLALLREINDLWADIRQLQDGFMAGDPNFTEWDHSVRNRSIAMSFKIDAALAKSPAKDAPYVAWCCYGTNDDDTTTIQLCDSDHPKAFKVYRHPVVPRVELQQEVKRLTPEEEEEVINRTPDHAVCANCGIAFGEHCGVTCPHPHKTTWVEVCSPEEKRLSECPTCGCTNPAHHPAVQAGGEVQLCENPWHQPTAAQIRAREAVASPKEREL